MAETASNSMTVQSNGQNIQKSSGEITRRKVEKTYSEELIIGICAPIGAVKGPVIEALETVLKYTYGYECEVIKLSKFITEHGSSIMRPGGAPSRFEEMNHLIDQGNSLREKYKSSSFLVELAITDIFKKRFGKSMPNDLSALLESVDISEILDKASESDEPNNDQIFLSKRKCYIIDSIKTKEELLLLRSIYRELFYFISIFTPELDRKQILSEKSLNPEEIIKIIDKDANESDNEFGQKVRDTFVLGDFFLRVTRDNQKHVDKKVRRFIDLIFDTRIVTPTIHETAMYHAKSAASNSACLSRQVGAAVTDKDGKVLSIGWNDVPKYGGSLYQAKSEIEETKNDGRCMFKSYNDLGEMVNGTGMCFNDHEKAVISKELLNILIEGGLIKEEEKELALKTIRNSKIKDIIEYSRAVHAEMHAMIIASQTSGASMQESKLYCTTYPCHNCARHIVAAGISEVYYIEPYVKSLSTRLHADAITENEEEKDKVKILMFEGVAPNRYLKFFSIHNKRKGGDGTVTITGDDSRKAAKPKTQLSLRALPLLEVQAVHALKNNGFQPKS